MMYIINIILVLCLCVPALYYFIFAVAGRAARERIGADSAVRSRFAILIPAYRSDSFIADTVRAALDQDYPEALFRVLVISDGMQESTDAMLRGMGADVLKVEFEQSSKAAALAAAVEYMQGRAVQSYGNMDYALILDSDNIVRRDFVSSMNKLLAGRHIAVQAHRRAKNMDTSVAVADAVSEEVNNLVFRAGHCALGLSSALIGSGMAFPYGWFAGSARDFVTAGEDKEMELRLLRDGIYVEYASGIDVLDEKTRSMENLQKQRLRWLNSQYALMGKALKGFSSVKLKAGYIDKLFQWLFPPRVLIIAGLPFVALLALLFRSAWSGCYLGCTLMLVFAFILGKPASVGTADVLGVFLEIPKMLINTIINIFSTGKANKGFIHTDHDENCN